MNSSMRRSCQRVLRRFLASTSAPLASEHLSFELVLESEQPDYLQSRYTRSHDAPAEPEPATPELSVSLSGALESYASVAASLGQKVDPRRVKSVVEFLSEADVAAEELQKCFLRYPELMLMPLEQLKADIEQFRDAGMKRSAIFNMLLAYPEIFGFHFEQDLQPILDFFTAFLSSPNAAIDLISRVPVLLTYHLEREIRPKIEFLQDLGLKVWEIQSIIESYPSVLCLSLERSIQAKIDYLQNRLPGIRIQQAIVAFPGFLDMSLEAHIKEKVEFFLDTLRVDPVKFTQYLPHFPQIFSCEIQNNIKHKIEVLCLRMDIVKGRRKRMKIMKPRSLGFMACPSLFGFSQNHLLKRIAQIRGLCFKNDEILEHLFLQVPLLFGCTVEFRHIQSVTRQLLEAVRSDRSHFLKIVKRHPQILHLSPSTLASLLAARGDLGVTELTEWISDRDAVKAALLQRTDLNEKHLSRE